MRGLRERGGSKLRSWDIKGQVAPLTDPSRATRTHRPPSFATRALALTAALACAALPAQAGGASGAEGGPRRLAVAAAANLEAVAAELARAFEAASPGVDVVVTTGASGALYAQLRNGAPFDVFLSADRDYPARLVAEGLASGERVYAVGRLVVWRPAGSPVDLERRGLAALADPAVRRIALANPAVAPFGRAAEQALRAAGVLDAVREKLVRGTSVAQAAQFATTGAADVAFLSSSLALEERLREGRAWAVPEALHAPIAQAGVVVSASAEPELARAFLDFVAGERGRALLARHGYGLP